MFLFLNKNFEKKKRVLIYGMNVFQTEIKIKVLNRPVPISVLTFFRKSLSVVVMDLNIYSKFIIQWAQTLCRRILAAFSPTTVHYFCVNVFQLERDIHQGVWRSHHRFSLLEISSEMLP
jgi:hypothetical protein